MLAVALTAKRLHLELAAVPNVFFSFSVHYFSSTSWRDKYFIQWLNAFDEPTSPKPCSKSPKNLNLKYIILNIKYINKGFSPHILALFWPRLHQTECLIVARRASLLPLQSSAAFLWATFTFISASDASAADLWPPEVRKWNPSDRAFPHASSSTNRRQDDGWCHSSAAFSLIVPRAHQY